MSEMKRVLEVQKAALLAKGPPSVEERVRRLDVCIKLLLDNTDAFAAAVSEDFGGRPKVFTKFADVAICIDSLKFARSHVASWAKPEKRSVEFPLPLFGASNHVQCMPKGVVGVVSPWNYPVALAFHPLAGIFAAGNSVMIKPSEFTPKTADLMAKLFKESFDESVAYVCTGGPEVGIAFSQLPLDHLLYTGSTEVGRLVAKAAAENLVPCTLELGGKCPVIVGTSADLDVAALRIAHAKVLNAGQTCITCDYVFVPADKKDAFVEAFVKAVAEMFPKGVEASPDYASVITDRHFGRIVALVDEARAAGVEVVAATGGDDGGGDALEGGKPPRRMAPTLVVNPGDDLKISSEEIFGPPLVIRTYDAVEDAVAYVNARPRPLALYYFGTDKAEEDKILPRVWAGGVCVNDVGMHAVHEDMPFGGVGASGYGKYFGHEGFLEFSHVRSVHRQVPTSRQYVLNGIYPPYDKKGSMLPTVLGMKLTPAKDGLPCCIL